MTAAYQAADIGGNQPVVTGAFQAADIGVTQSSGGIKSFVTGAYQAADIGGTQPVVTEAARAAEASSTSADGQHMCVCVGKRRFTGIKNQFSG